MMKKVKNTVFLNNYRKVSVTDILDYDHLKNGILDFNDDLTNRLLILSSGGH